MVGRVSLTLVESLILPLERGTLKSARKKILWLFMRERMWLRPTFLFIIIWERFEVDWNVLRLGF